MVLSSLQPTSSSSSEEDASNVYGDENALDRSNGARLVTIQSFSEFLEQCVTGPVAVFGQQEGEGLASGGREGERDETTEDEEDRASYLSRSLMLDHGSIRLDASRVEREDEDCCDASKFQCTFKPLFSRGDDCSTAFQRGDAFVVGCRGITLKWSWKEGIVHHDSAATTVTASRSTENCLSVRVEIASAHVWLDAGPARTEVSLRTESSNWNDMPVGQQVQLEIVYDTVQYHHCLQEVRGDESKNHQYFGPLLATARLEFCPALPLLKVHAQKVTWLNDKTSPPWMVARSVERFGLLDSSSSSSSSSVSAGSITWQACDGSESQQFHAEQVTLSAAPESDQTSDDNAATRSIIVHCDCLLLLPSRQPLLQGINVTIALDTTTTSVTEIYGQIKRGHLTMHNNNTSDKTNSSLDNHDAERRDAAPEHQQQESATTSLDLRSMLLLRDTLEVFSISLDSLMLTTSGQVLACDHVELWLQQDRQDESFGSDRGGLTTAHEDNAGQGEGGGSLVRVRANKIAHAAAGNLVGVEVSGMLFLPESSPEPQQEQNTAIIDTMFVKVDEVTVMGNELTSALLRLVSNGSLDHPLANVMVPKVKVSSIPCHYKMDKTMATVIPGKSNPRMAAYQGGQQTTLGELVRHYTELIGKNILVRQSRVARAKEAVSDTVVSPVGRAVHNIVDHGPNKAVTPEAVKGTNGGSGTTEGFGNRLTNSIQQGVHKTRETVQAGVHKTRESIEKAASQGKLQRGASTDDRYQLGDFSRGVAASIRNRHQNHAPEESSSSFLGGAKESVSGAAQRTGSFLARHKTRIGSLAGSGVGAVMGGAVGGPVGMVAGSVAGSIAGSKVAAGNHPSANRSDNGTNGGQTASSVFGRRPDSFSTDSSQELNLYNTCELNRPHLQSTQKADGNGAAVGNQSSVSEAGKQEKEKFRLGDNIRGIVARGKNAAGRDENSAYRLGDFSRGLFVKK